MFDYGGMMNAIVKHESALPAMAMSEQDLIKVLESSLYPGVAPESIRMVVAYCRAAGLDPMLKPVHPVPMWDSKAGRMRDVVMPGIGLYRIQASRTGQFAGMSEPEFGPDVATTIGGQQITYPEWCRVTVKRALASGVIAEFTAREFWIENYAQKGGKEKSVAPNAMWTKRPRGQLAKCASAQALRIAFPELGAMPTADEMEGKHINEDAFESQIIREEPKPKVLPDYPPEQFSKNSAIWSDLISSKKKTAEDIIGMISSKYVLSEEQKSDIRRMAEPVIDGEWTAEYAAHEEGGAA